MLQLLVKSRSRRVWIIITVKEYSWSYDDHGHMMDRKGVRVEKQYKAKEHGLVNYIIVWLQGMCF